MVGFSLTLIWIFWNKVCVIGAKVWKEQFKGQNPIGKEVGINNMRFYCYWDYGESRRWVRRGEKRRRHDFHSDYNRTDPFWWA